MKQQWQKLAARIDTRNQRERALIFVMGLVVVGSLVNALWLDPLLVRKKKARQEVAAQQEQLRTLQDQIQLTISSGKPDPDAPTRAQLAQLEQKLAQSRAALESVQQNLVPPQRMARLLEDVLTQNRNLKLLSLKTLPASSVVEQPKSEAGNESAPASNGPEIYKHGVELAVSGSYADLTNYLEALEDLPWQMFWGRAEMRVTAHPQVMLTITLYTLSMDKAWLSI